MSEKKNITVSLDNLPERFAIFQTSEKQAEQLQNWLFENLGATWAGDSSAKVQATDKAVLYLSHTQDRGWKICYSSSDHWYAHESDSYVRLEFKQVTMFELTKVVDVVEIKGNKYDLDDVISAIKVGGVKVLPE